MSRTKPPPTESPASFVYNQTELWKKLVVDAKALSAPPPLGELVTAAVERYQKKPLGPDGVNYETIVHMVFDRPIVPQGGILLSALRSNGASTPPLEQLKAMGYLVQDDKVVEVNGAPVSPAYGALNYWGGEKQFKRWHLNGPIEANPSRNGNPLFMDEEMLAFGAKWRDLFKMRDALLDLCMLFAQGVDHQTPIAVPLVLEVTPAIGR